jgi:hypothetical protein
MNGAFVFRKRAMKDVMTEEKRGELRANIGKHVQAYINSGGQIQQCTPFTFSTKETVTARQKRMNK